MEIASEQDRGDHLTTSLMEVVAKLRPDLTVYPQSLDGQSCHVIEDPLTGQFFRIGGTEFRFISLLNGRRTIGEALEILAREQPDSDFSENRAAGLVHWLVDSGLAVTQATRSNERQTERRSQRELARWWENWNPVMARIPLFRPDPVLERMARVIRPISNQWFLSIWFLMLGLAGGVVWSRGEDWLSQTNRLAHLGAWAWIGLTWLLLKLIHETAHGLVCKRMGGYVRQAGVFLIVLFPMPFVDVTSSWRFLSRWKRMAVAAAGMAAELFVAALATFVWAFSTNEVWQMHAHNIMVVATVSTILFNANPLMRFDGYYLLSDGLEISNLYSRGRQWLIWVLQRFLVGLDSPLPENLSRRTSWIAVYAVAALIWRILIGLLLVLLAESLIAGVGILLAILAAVVWWGYPVWRAAKFLFDRQGPVMASHRRRVAVVLASLFGVIFMVGYGVPWPSHVWAPAVVEYGKTAEIRATTGGFVREVFYREGMAVCQGQLLVRLENPELDVEIADLRSSRQQSEVRCRQYQTDNNRSGLSIEFENLRAIEAALAERIRQRAALDIRSPIDGVVNINESGQEWVGRFVDSRTVLCEIGSSGGFEIRAAVPQDHVSELSDERLATARFLCIQDRFQSYPIRIESIEPRATVRDFHPALLATSGGPLTVRVFNQGGNDGQNSRFEELSAPHVLARCQIASPGEPSNSQLRRGMTGWILISGSSQPLGVTLSRHLRSWIRKQRATIRDATSRWANSSGPDESNSQALIR